MISKRVLAALTSGVVVVSGCGDDGDAFRARADRACTERHRAVVQAYDTARKEGATGSALISATEGAQIQADAGLLRDLRQLDPPKELESTYSEFLTAHQHRLDLLEAGQRARQRRDSEAVNADRERSSGLQDEWYALGRAMGLEACGGAVPAAEKPKIRAAVERALADRGASSVEILEIEGTEQYAEVEILPKGGSFDSEVVNANVTLDDGKWAVAAITPVGSRGSD